MFNDCTGTASFADNEGNDLEELTEGDLVVLLEEEAMFREEDEVVIIPLLGRCLLRDL